MSNVTPRTLLILGGLTLLTILLVALALPLLPGLWDWRPYDYELYRTWGKTFLDGTSPFNPYPLPSIIWVFVPLALLPPQFAIFWSAAPFGFVLYLLRGRGILLWLYFPLLVQTAFGQLEGWLILPMSWLLTNRPKLAPLGSVLLMVKPSVAPLVILYMLWYWLTHKEWQQLKWFSGILFIYLLPAFLIDPFWVMRFLTKLPVRAVESNMIPRGASLWAWIWHGGFAIWLLPVVLVLVLLAVVYLLRRSKNLSETANVSNMFLVPTLYVSTFTLLIPNFKTSREVLVMVVISWLAALLDILIGGWGGVYAIIPFAALLLLVQRARLGNPTPDEKLRR